MPQSALIAAFLAGLLGGLHCFAMCSGWIAVTGRRMTAAPLTPAGSLRIGQAASHAGRLTTYMLLGALFGAAGGAAFAVAIAPVQLALYVIANLMLLALAASIAFRGAGFAALERFGLELFRRLLPVVARVAPRGGAGARFVLGSVWGFTPCALVYGVLPVALLAGSATNGALVMLAFGLGTLPNLLAAGWTLARARRLLTRSAYRYAAAALVGGFAIAGLYRAWFVPGSLGQGPFCLFP